MVSKWLTFFFSPYRPKKRKEKKSVGSCDHVSVHGTVNLLGVVNNSGSVLRCFQQQLIHHSLSVVARSGHPAHTNPLQARQCVAALRCNPTLDTSGSRLYFKPTGKIRLACRRQQWRCCRSSKHTTSSKNSSRPRSSWLPFCINLRKPKSSQTGNETQRASILKQNQFFAAHSSL